MQMCNALNPPSVINITKSNDMHICNWRYLLACLSKTFVATVYPEILAIIKFGDLHKIRLYFNIGRN